MTSVAFARPLTVAEKNADIQQLASLIKSQYAPLALKRQQLDLRLPELVDRYQERAEKASNQEFYYLLNQMVSEFQDGHFKSTVKTDHKSTLGFVSDVIGDEVVIETVSTGLLSPFVFPFTRGDVVVSIDGVKAMDAVKDLEKYFGMPNPAARRRSAAFHLTFRNSAVMPPKTGKSKVVVYSRENKAQLEVELDWHEAGTPPDEMEKEWSPSDDRPLTGMEYQNLSAEGIYSGFPEMEKGFMCNAKTRFRPPKGAQPLMLSPFVAYVHDSPKGKIGYLRLPHFNWGKDADTRIKQYEWAIYQLEKQTEGLVVDATHNCGGALSTLEELLKMFAVKPFNGVQFEFLSTRSELLTVKGWMDNESVKTTLQGEGLTGILDAITTAYAKGDRLSAKTTWNGKRELLPSSIRYTKPMIVLTDEMSASGGDAFPAMMQGTGRALVMGTRSMGAGGHVVSAAPLQYSGNEIRITKSLFYHPNGKPIEGLGVTPDVVYEPTIDDYLSGYVPYQKAVFEQLFKKIDESKGVKPGALAWLASWF